MKDNVVEFAEWWKSVYKEKLAAVYIDERFTNDKRYEMNANELSDEFKNRNWDEVDVVLWCEKAATMLDQQQAEIKELKQQVAFLEDWRDTWSPTIKQLMNINVKVNDE